MNKCCIYVEQSSANFRSKLCDVMLICGSSRKSVFTVSVGVVAKLLMSAVFSFDFSRVVGAFLALSSLRTEAYPLNFSTDRQ